MSDSLSLAPTEVYGSPSSTPRRISLASSVAMSERRTSTKLWDLPEFGNSPVSSPPRTPPPEPTPPPTPPPVSFFEGFVLRVLCNWYSLDNDEMIYKIVNKGGKFLRKLGSASMGEYNRVIK